MCNLFNFDAPAARTAAEVEQPAMPAQEAGYLADGQSGPLVRINAMVASALFDPEGPGFDAPNWVIISGMARSKFVIVNTDQSPRPKDIVHPNGWKVYFRRYVSDTGVVPYTPAPAIRKAIDAVCVAANEEEIKAVVMGLMSTAAVDAAMLGIAAGFRSVELAATIVNPIVDREVEEGGGNAAPSTGIEGEVKILQEATGQQQEPPAPPASDVRSAPKDTPPAPPAVSLVVVQGMLTEACRDRKLVAKNANEAARIYTTIVVDDTVSAMLEALITMGDPNRLRKLKRAVPETHEEVA